MNATQIKQRIIEATGAADVLSSRIEAFDVLVVTFRSPLGRAVLERKLRDAGLDVFGPLRFEGVGCWALYLSGPQPGDGLPESHPPEGGDVLADDAGNARYVGAEATGFKLGDTVLYEGQTLRVTDILNSGELILYDDVRRCEVPKLFHADELTPAPTDNTPPHPGMPTVWAEDHAKVCASYDALCAAVHALRHDFTPEALAALYALVGA